MAKMNSVFPVDEISDSYWPPPPPPPGSAADSVPGAMGRSQSEWALERLLAEVTGSGSIPPPSCSIPPPDPKRVVEGRHLDDLVEIKKPNGQLAQLNQPPPKVPVNPDDSHAFLKNQLEIACAAVARLRVSTLPPSLLMCDNTRMRVCIWHLWFFFLLSRCCLLILVHPSTNVRLRTQCSYIGYVRS